MICLFPQVEVRATLKKFDMKNRMNELFSNRFIKALADKVSVVNGMVQRNLGRPLINLFIRIGYSVVGVNKSYVRVYKEYAFFVYKLYAKGGLKYVVIYLKACSVLLQQAAGGQRLSSTQLLGAAVARTKSGIPRVIPILHRRRILSRETKILKL